MTDMEEYYAILYLEHRINSRSIYAEFFDSNTVEELLSESIGTVEFWSRVDILTANINNEMFDRIFPDATSQNGINPVFKVVLQVPPQDRTSDRTIYYYEYLANNNGEIQRNRAAIGLVTEVTDGDRDMLLNQFTNGPLTEDLHGNVDIKDLPQTGLLFTVHDIGQGLATSISEINKIPFLYFDYGMTVKKNFSSIKFLPVDCQNTRIILSHVDEDHWYSYRKNNQALKCTWYVPDQVGKGIYYQFLARISANNGKAILYKKGFTINNFEICHSTTSLINSKRNPKQTKTHETGYGMYISAMTNNNEKSLKILIAGDQDYDYQNPQYLKDLDILVACHHGGSYCWSKKFAGITPASDSSTVIYSYGIGNKYKHPTKTSDYQNWGWKKEHHTAKDGDFTVTIN